jgi:hypothetical protein
VRINFRTALIGIAVAFVLLSIWNNPAGTAESFSNFLGDVGGWIEDLIDKATDFFRGLTE